MKRRILLVDDEVAVLLTMKAVLEISGFDVETAASAREGKLRLRSHEFHMVITDMRMENDEAGREVIRAARTAVYRPAVALLTAFPVDEADWQDLGAHQLLLKPMHTRILLEQIEKLLAARELRVNGLATNAAAPSPAKTAKAPVKKAVAKKKVGAKQATAKKSNPVKQAASRKTVAAKQVVVTSKPAEKAIKAAKPGVKKAAIKKSVTRNAIRKTATKVIKKAAGKRPAR